MPAACRLGDFCSGHSCWPPRNNYEASVNVFLNGLGWHRQGDGWVVHCCGKKCHDGHLSMGSPSVYVNGLQAGRIGDPISCGSVIIQGSGNVYCGD